MSMKVCNIFSISNQRHYDDEQMVMILAQYLKRDLYDPKYFEHKYIIVDNGLYEGEQVSSSLQYLVELIESKNIKVDEIIIPDVLNDYTNNIILFMSNLDTVRRYNNKYKFMFVAHGSSFDETRCAVEYINKNYSNLNLSIGIPKKCNFDRTSEEAIEVYKKSKLPIHFLGMKDTETFNSLKVISPYVRSCDTALASIITLYHNGVIFEENVSSYMDYKRGSNEKINLEYHCVFDKSLEILLKEIRRNY